MKTDFFQTGGTLSEDAPCYIERPADEQLLNALDRGELCMILAPRQTGKSSLMIHAIAELKKIGIRAAIVDLQPLAIQKEPAAWFNDVVYQIERSLRLDTDALSWWQDNARLGPTQRFMTFMEDVVLSEIQERVVIFFDEIDSVLSLPFSDDFFTTLRAMVNAKANNPVLRRLNFVLLGVANPSDFIKNRSRTPFNIGKEIPLTDFDPASVSRFEEVIGNDSKSVLDRIFYWTAGQPQMVQKLAEAVYPLPAEERSPEKIDDIVQKAYLGTRIDSNVDLKFIRDYLLEGHKKVRKTLNTYKSVLDGKPVAYDEQSPVHSRLRLSGVAKAENNTLVSRNRVYQTVFDKQWIKQNTPRDKAKIAIYSLSFSLVAVLAWFFLKPPIIFTALRESRYYAAEKQILLSVEMPPKDIMRVEADEQKIPLEEDKGFRNDNIIRISFENLKVGENLRLVRFYGKKDNFEKMISIFYDPNLKMIKIPPGEFMMGSPGDEPGRYNEIQHRVTLTKGFEMQKTEVTQAQWMRLMRNNNPSEFKNCGGDCPVEKVSWDDVQKFIRRLNTVSNGNFRLPTEAEWEYAARAGSQKAFTNGDITNAQRECGSDSNLDKIGWYCVNSGNKTHKVAQKYPNAWGLYDMHGNVWEWVQDWYGNYHSGAVTDPTGPNEGSSRISRGGSWNNSPRFCRSANRRDIPPGSKFSNIGFRLVRDAD